MGPVLEVFLVLKCCLSLFNFVVCFGGYTAASVRHFSGTSDWCHQIHRCQCFLFWFSVVFVKIQTRRRAFANQFFDQYNSLNSFGFFLTDHLETCRFQSHPCCPMCALHICLYENSNFSVHSQSVLLLLAFLFVKGLLTFSWSSTYFDPKHIEIVELPVCKTSV